jgi:Putative DNA-binding domain
MALQLIPLGKIDEARLRALIDGRASETRDIEYRRDTYGGTDKDHAEYLADVSSFANTAGGDLIIGMTANKGIPTSLAPLAIDVDAEILRLENIARSGLQPRIVNLTMRAVSVAGGHVLVIRVPRSYNPPHRVIRQGTGQHRFHARSSAGKYEPNVDELRLLFLRAPHLADRIRDFRTERIAKIAANDVPVRLLDTHALTLHVIPFSGFDARIPLPLGSNVQWYNTFPPLLSIYPQHFRINVDGLLTLSHPEANAKAQRAYVQVYHTGIVEAVASSFLMGEGTAESPNRLTALRTEACIVKYSHIYLRALGALGCAPPFAILVSLIGVKGIEYSFATGSVFFEDGSSALDRDQFHFSEVIIEDVPADPYEYAKLVRPLLNQIANAAGRAATPTFDETGGFRLKVD